MKQHAGGESSVNIALGFFPHGHTSVIQKPPSKRRLDHLLLTPRVTFS